MTVIEPNVFKMRVKEDFPLWKRIFWRMLGTKSCGSMDGYYVEGYWYRNICLITRFELDEDESD